MEREQPNRAYTQPTLEGLVPPEPETIELANCLVLAPPRFTATEKHKQWSCDIHAQPSIFQPDIDAVYTATASNEFAVQARKKSLKPGDRAAVIGIVSTQIIEYANGKTETMHTIVVKDIQVFAREKRVSTTVFEQQRKR